MKTFPTDHAPERAQTNHEPVRSDGQRGVTRIADRLANVQSYWATQTPQAHHIVEFNNLEELGISSAGGTGELDYNGLPCVLFVSEFHQRYISSLLKCTHSWEAARGQLLARLRRLYASIYGKRAPELLSLWRISEIILDAAERRLKR